MNCKKECIAMLLAGGQGSRLHDLTRYTAKPAVSFGGKYRIIDFALSNCTNSGIDTVGVLTQYEPLDLNEYIGNGAPWDLDRARGGVSVLPPYQGAGHADWYRGTANAIYQNLAFVRRYDPEYVLILSGDHVYRMDYSRMLAAHKRTGASCTVATVTVPLAEARRFGICNTDENGKILEFEEKPDHPRSDQASMGVYIFNTGTLVEYLEMDEADYGSHNDFGKDVIPRLLHGGEPLYAYRFSGYWKDVGTVVSLWEANMDLLGENSVLYSAEREFDVYSRTVARPPQFIGERAVVRRAMIADGTVVNGTVTDSVLSDGVVVSEGAEVHHSVIMPDAKIGKGARIHYAIVDGGTVVAPGAVIGSSEGGNCNITLVGQNGSIECPRSIG